MFTLRKVLFCILIVRCSYATQPLYQFNFDKLEAANQQITLTESKYPFLAHQFATARKEAKRQPPPEKQNFEFAKEFARTFRTTGELPLWDKTSIESVTNAIITYFTNKERFPDGNFANTQVESFLTGLPNHIKTKMSEYNNLCMVYQRYVEQMGLWRQWKFVDIIHNILLNPSEEGCAFFQTLKQTAFLQSPFDLTLDFHYDPRIVISYYLMENETVDSLVLGCGHHLDTEVTDQLSAIKEAGCAMCDITDFHKGELTVALHGHDNADVIADMHDTRIWEVLSSRQWKKISDHSWSASLQRDETLISIYKSLAPGGIFEIWDEWTNEKESQKEILVERLAHFGFQFKNIDEARKTINFIKL